MYSSYPTFVYGFHGCDKSIAAKVLNPKEQLIASRNGYDWLGTGIYFWENDPTRALEFAQEQTNLGKYKDPCVIGAVIELKNCLNFLDRKFLSLLPYSYEDLVNKIKITGEKLPENKSRKKTDFIKLVRFLDSAVIENLHAMLENSIKYDTVRGAFIEGDDVYPGSGFKSKTHIQVCVRNHDCIKGLFFPRESINQTK